MSHAATIRGAYERLGAHDLDGFGGLIADDFVEHEELPSGATDKAGVLEFFAIQIAGFPDLGVEVDDIIDAGDTVVARVRFTGTHDGEFMGMPPTGRAIDVPAIDIFRFAGDGRVSEHWGVFDAMRMMQQLGAAPG
jgi:steroid delta-isomerase-like uncharacterized protein